MTPEAGVSSRRERKKEATHARIVDAATELFRRQGYQATSIENITDAADVAPRTFYAYFDAKVDVAMVQLEYWVGELETALHARPASETPDQMYAAALADLGSRGFVTGQRLRDESGQSFPPMGVGLLLAETEPEVAGRIYQILVRLQASMTSLFRQRLDLPPGSIEPHVVAGAITASWFVAVHGFTEMAASHDDPPSTDELGIRSFALYASGLDKLWTGATTPAGPGHGPDASGHASLEGGEEVR